MKQKIILLSGVHGVGKGYYLKNNIAKTERFTILEASALIKRYKDADDAGYKRVKDILDNQQLLSLALKNEKNSITNDIILDGHICLLNSKGEIERIPEEFIIESDIDGIILFQDDVENIVKRQVLRDGKNLPKEIVKTIQVEEIKYCKLLYDKYKLPYHVIDNNCDYQHFCEIANSM